VLAGQFTCHHRVVRGVTGGHVQGGDLRAAPTIIVAARTASMVD
jgi:hypothetical protein